MAASAWTGIHAARRLRRTHEELLDLRAALGSMGTEIAFAATPCGPLCRRAGAGRTRAVERFFTYLAEQSEKPRGWGENPAERACAASGLALPGPARRCLERVFDRFGLNDREGELRQLQLADAELARLLEELETQMEGRCRSYQVLGLTAGAAMLVLVL